MSPPERQHRLRRMTGRDPDERHRVATPLELLFDLTFVAAFAQAGDQAAHLAAEGHVGHALAGFGFVVFAVCWAWVNFSWFASAFDTDDWFFRVMTMVQMVGVLVVALGAPPVFDSIDRGEPLGNGVVVAGYVVMRVAMVAQWLRAATQDPRYRRFALTFAVAIAVSQVGWTAVPFLHRPVGELLPLLVVLYLVELGGPVLASRTGEFPPWHPHHIAERYGLLVMITLGEIVLGTIAAVAAVVERSGWTVEAVLVVVAGTGLAFGVWWSYFVVPTGDILARHRGRAWLWGYGGIVVFAAVAAMGAGLHVAAYVAGGEASIGTVGAVLVAAVPVLVTVLAYLGIYAYLVGAFDPFHTVLIAGAVVVLALAVLLAGLGVGLGACLLVVTAAPAVIVVGYETVGYRHMDEVMARVLG